MATICLIKNSVINHLLKENLLYFQKHNFYEAKIQTLLAKTDNPYLKRNFPPYIKGGEFKDLKMRRLQFHQP